MEIPLRINFKDKEKLIQQISDVGYYPADIATIFN